MASLPPVADVEFEFSGRDFDRVRELIHAKAGISLNASKRTMVYSRLSRRLRATGVESFAKYLDSLERGGAANEWQEFVNALTTNLTAFFREPHHFPVLSTLLKSVAHRPSITIWCAAASTGEEPYSIAITARELLGRAADKVRILASDIDTNVLEKAQRGVYPVEVIEKLDPAMARRCFLRGGGAHEGFAKVRPEVASLIEFLPVNLLAADWPIPGELDAIFCRNVMIYFDKPTQASLLARMTPMLQPWGLYFAGHSENLGFARHLLAPKGHTVYGRADAASASERAS
ncbi:chemotaxis protein CheR [Betaproteobacteria bacterium GR16-43]|nr:chemotaxis protein CheR [Betaproteobacteria bacterium GR16-43]